MLAFLQAKHEALSSNAAVEIAPCAQSPAVHVACEATVQEKVLLPLPTPEMTPPLTRTIFILKLELELGIKKGQEAAGVEVTVGAVEGQKKKVCPPRLLVIAELRATKMQRGSWISSAPTKLMTKVVLGLPGTYPVYIVKRVMRG